MLVIVPSPIIDLRSRVVSRLEPVGVQTLLPEPVIEGLDHGVVRGLAAPTEVERHPVRVRPQIHLATDKFRAVVAVGRSRYPSAGTLPPPAFPNPPAAMQM